MNSNVNTNRLLNDSYTLNTKVEQYRKALSKSYTNYGIDPSKYYTENINKKSQSIFNSGESQFCPNWNINSLGSLSKEFVEMSNKPEDVYNSENKLNSNKDNMLINVNDNSMSSKSQKYMIANLKQSYDNHINDLYNNFKTCLSKLEEIGSMYSSNIHSGINTNSSNNISNSSKQDCINTNLIKQVINENLFYERENQIANFIDEISHLKAIKTKEEEDFKRKVTKEKESMKLEYEKSIQNQDKINEQLKTENCQLKDNIKHLEEEATKLTDENETFRNEIERLKKVINVMEIDLNEADRNLMEKTNEAEEIKEQFQDLQKKFYDTNIENRKVLEENKSLQGLLENNETEKNEIMDRLNNISMNEYNSYISDIKGDHTISNYAGGNNKIINDLRLEKEQLNDELTTMAEKYEDSQRNFNNFVKSVQDKENCLKGDWIKKLNKHKEEYENIIVNLKKKQMKEIEQINTEHSIKLEEKEKLIAELKKSVAILKTYEKNYIKITDHENQLKKALTEQKNKLQL